jgi:hypothetical protein
LDLGFEFIWITSRLISSNAISMAFEAEGEFLMGTEFLLRFLIMEVGEIESKFKLLL